MSATATFAPAGKRRLVAVLAALTIVGGAAFPASAAPQRSDVQPLAAVPEVWEAYDNDRLMAGSAHGRFVLPVPAGSYTISAKLSANSNPGQADEIIECELSATSSNGRNWDRTNVRVDAPSDAEAMSLSLIHVFPSAGSIVLDCRHLFPGQGEETTLYYVKIMAIRVNAVTWVPL